MRDLSSSGTFNRDLMEYSFGNGTTSCLLSNSNQGAHLISNATRNQGIRISFDFAASDLMLPSSPISNCSSRQPSIVSGYDIPIINPSSSQKTNNNLLTVQRPSRLSGSISNEELIYLNKEMHSSGTESNFSAPEQGQNKIVIPSTFSYINKSGEHQRLSSFSKFKLSKQKRRKLKAQLKQKIKRSEHDENLNLNIKDKLFLTVNEPEKKSGSYLNILRRSFKSKSSKNEQCEQ